MAITSLRRTAFLTLVTLSCVGVIKASEPPQQLNDEDRGRFISEIRNYKHEFLTRDLNLTRDQQRDFLPLYDEMEDEVQRLNAETRDLELQVDADETASDTEIEAASRAVFEQKIKEGKIEMDYYEKFSKVLTPRQVLRIKSSEKKFMQSLMKQHRRIASRRMRDEK